MDLLQQTTEHPSAIVTPCEVVLLVSPKKAALCSQSCSLLIQSLLCGAGVELGSS